MNIRSITIFLTCLLFCAGCAQKGDTETISVAPASLQAGYKLASYQINVTSNASWTSSVPAAASSWLSLPTSGSGNEEISLRVLKNGFADERSATIEFATKSGARASLQILQEGDTTAATKKVDLRIGTYNLRMSTITESETFNNWDVRKSRLKTSIEDNAMDVFGVQEVSTVQQKWLDDSFGSTYSRYIFSPYAQSGQGDKAQGILYNTSKFQLMQSGYFWACSTPDTMTENDKGDQGNFKRGGCWVILKDKGTGIEFFFMNNHGCLNQSSNTANAQYYKQIEQKYNTTNLPSFFVGDMNARPEYEATSTYLLHWKDSFAQIPDAKKAGCTNTYNGYSSPQGKYRLDYIYYRGTGINLNKFCVNNELFGGKYASDHFPVYLDITLIK